MTRQSARRVAFALLLLATVSASPTRAQSGSAKIEGSVLDSQQPSMPQAVIEVQDSQGNTVRKVITDDAGRYHLDAMPPGTYTIKASRNGSETVTKGPVTVFDRQGITLDIALLPQSVAQSVTAVGSGNDRQVGSKTNIPMEVLPVGVKTGFASARRN
jgi:hypothetical protein